MYVVKYDNFTDLSNPECKFDQIKEYSYIFRNTLNWSVKLCNNTGNNQKNKMQKL